jgi:hypothetical protein
LEPKSDSDDMASTNSSSSSCNKRLSQYACQWCADSSRLQHPATPGCKPHTTIETFTVQPHTSHSISYLPARLCSRLGVLRRL